jgi:fructoselysine-6-P-deglycase FrlB-like protein
MVTLCLHGAVLEALGAEQRALRDVLTAAPIPQENALRKALDALRASCYVIFSGRAELQGIAEVSALHAAELAQLPALALEGGQFRHGPLELLEPDVGVVLMRAGGPSADLTDALVEVCLEAGSRVIVLDASGATPLTGAITLAFPPLSGLAAAVVLLPSLQRLLLGVAQQRVTHVGQPRRSSKITGER